MMLVAIEIFYLTNIDNNIIIKQNLHIKIIQQLDTNKFQVELPH